MYWGKPQKVQNFSILIQNKLKKMIDKIDKDSKEDIYYNYFLKNKYY